MILLYYYQNIAYNNSSLWCKWALNHRFSHFLPSHSCTTGHTHPKRHHRSAMQLVHIISIPNGPEHLASVSGAWLSDRKSCQVRKQASLILTSFPLSPFNFSPSLRRWIVVRLTEPFLINLVRRDGVVLWPAAEVSEGVEGLCELWGEQLGCGQGNHAHHPSRGVKN